MPQGEPNNKKNGGARTIAAGRITRVALLAMALSACGGGGAGGTANPPPQRAVNACVDTAAGQTLTGTLPGSGTGATYAAGAVQPAKGDVAIDIAGNYRYTPRTDLPSGDGRARGIDVFSYRATDPSGLSTEATVTVLIDDAVRVMPLGDSITAGVASGVPVQQQIGYRRKLYTDLEALDARYRIDFVGSQNAEGADASPPLADRDHEGHPGACDDNQPDCVIGGDRKPALDEAVIGILNNNPADFVLLHIGTNRFSADASGVSRILDEISSWATANYPVHVFLARIIPSRDGTLIDGSATVSTFNDNVQAVAHDRPNAKIFVVDQQSELQVAGDPNRADPALMADNLHPNQTGYERMANRWRNVLVASGVLPACD